MKRLAVILLFVLFSFNLSKPTDSKVYVFDSNTAIAYHKTKACRGLETCTHEIKLVPLKDAINVYGRQACMVCYK